MARTLLIAGCHSSGTSAAGAVLTACGLPTLTDQLDPTPTHPFGYFESRAVTAANGFLMAAGGAPWFDPGALAPVPANIPARGPMREIVENLPEGDLFLKDPRFCRTLPYWVKALGDVGREVAVLIPVRDPLEVAASLMKKHRFSLHHGLRLWQRYVTESLAGSTDLPRLIVPHDLPWRKLATGVRDDLGFDLKVKGRKPQLFEPEPLPAVTPADQALLQACQALKEQALENAGLHP